MTLEEMLKREDENVRLEHRYETLYWDNSCWIVHSKYPYESDNYILYHGKSLDQALEALLKGRR